MAPSTSLTIFDLLEADSRPTFAIQVDSTRNVFNILQPSFFNEALRSQLSLTQHALAESSSPLYLAFCQWVYSGYNELGGIATTYRYAAYEWHRIDVAHEWIVIGGTCALPSSEHIKKRKETSAMGRTMSSSEWEQGEDLDWTCCKNPQKLSPYAQYLRTWDWGPTAAGHMANWDLELRLMLNLMVASPHPALLMWGEDLVYFYNESQIPQIGAKHPIIQGSKSIESWSEIWTQIRPAFAKGFKTGEATETKQLFFLVRHGFPEETHFTYTVIPVVNRYGKVAGFYIHLYEITAQVLAQRRLATVFQVSQQSAGSVALEELWERLLTALESNKEDITFAVMYSYEAFEPFSDTPQSPRGICHLTGAIGIPKEILDGRILIGGATGGFARSIELAFNETDEILLRKCDGSLPESIVNAIDPNRGHGAQCEKAVLFALRPTDSGRVLGFGILGLQSTRYYDQDYKEFTKLLGGQIAAALASTVTHQDEIKRKEEQANLEQAILRTKLLKQERETAAAERRFKSIFDMAPTSISIARPDGSHIYVNDMWRGLFGYDAIDQESGKWWQHIWHEDKQATAEAWQKLVVDHIPVQYELRLTKPWTDQTCETMNFPYTWVLVNAYPEFSEDGELCSIVSSLTNISHLKWIQGDAQRRAADAVEAKRQQDNFTDMVAHEIRNPLNAVVQCSDAISETIRAVSTDSVDLNEQGRVFEEIINNAETITYCANHQKKIVNDLLVLSKLDSDLLTFKLFSSQPARLLQQTTRMFAAQARSSDINIEPILHPSVEAYNVDWVMIDPDRVSQVLINLLTNAIKFTAQQPRRHISVTLEVARDPSSFIENRGIQFFPSHRTRSGPISALPSERLFLLFSVQDTGKGVTPAEQERLFQRFSQASVRTHVKYGGSGLGLWISRELTEMQGGEIGLVPDLSNGSTFAFYVPASHSLPPEDHRVRPSSNISQIRPQSLKRSTEREMVEASNEPDLDLKTITILLTEDNLLNQKVMKRQLDRVFKTVLVANHGQDALDVISQTRHWRGSPAAPANDAPSTQSNRSDLAIILMDIEMPVMGGVECTKRIRALESAGIIDKRIPIIAISANARAEQIREYLDAGMDETLAKPFLIKDLVAVIRRLL